MRILGIDPGSRKTGFGIVEFEQNRRQFIHIAHGVLYLDVEQNLVVRSRELATRLRAVIVQYAPTHAAIEDIFVSENVRSALMLGQARGVALAVLGLADLSVVSLAATQVKNAVTGTGRADKKQVGEMVKRLLGLEKIPAQDASDALAVAIACAHMRSISNQNASFPIEKMSRRHHQTALLEIARRQGKL